jgi:hypothetical protein
LGKVGALVTQGEAPEKIVELRLTAIEGFRVVVKMELPDGRNGHGVSAFSKALGSLSSRSSRGMGCGGASSAAMKAAHCSSFRRNRRRSAMTSAALDKALSSKNSETVLLDVVAASCKARFTLGVVRMSMRWFRGSFARGMGLSPFVILKI